MKTWIKATIISIVVIPALIFSWQNIMDIWAGPEKIAVVSKKVDTQSNVQDQLSKLVVEQQARIDKNEAVYQANLESTKEQLTLIAELKRKK